VLKLHIGGQRKLHNEELHKFCSSQNIITTHKSTATRWAGNVAHGGY